MRILMRWFAAAMVAALSSLPADAQSIESLFKGKQLRIVTGSAAGQDYDLWARFIARHLGRHVPGNPTVIVQNMPGAGEMLATNWLFNVAPRDGTVWGTVGRNIPNAGFQGAPGARYDATKFQWLGSPENTNRGCFAMAKAKVQKAEDLFEQELIVGTIGAGATVTETPNLLRGLLGMKFKMVDGYVRPQDVVLAMERGEVEGVCQTVQSFSRAKPEWLKNGTARVLFTAERDRVPGVNAPTIFQFAKTDEQRAILAFTASTLGAWAALHAAAGRSARGRACDAACVRCDREGSAVPPGGGQDRGRDHAQDRGGDRGLDHEGRGDSEGDHRPGQRTGWAREALTASLPPMASSAVAVYGTCHGAPGRNPAM